MRTPLLVLALLATAAARAGAGEAPTDPELARRVWDLSPVYASPAAWERELERVRADVGRILRLRGTLGIGPEALADALDAISELRARVARMVVYGYLRSETETGSEEARRIYDVATATETQVESVIAFAAEEVRALGAEPLELWMAREPRLGRHRARIGRVLAAAPHTLGAEAESVLESAARWPRLSADLWEALQSSGLGRIARDGTGSGAPLDRAAYLALRASPPSPDRDRDLRRYLDGLAPLEDLFALLYTRRVEADLILARHRRFESGIDALWFLHDGMPVGSFGTMLAATRERLDVLHRFARLRGAIGAGAVPRYENLYGRPPGAVEQFPLRRAMEIAVAASAPLGSDYVARLRALLARPWLDLAPRPGKSATYAIWPPVGGMPPYFQMSYQGTPDSARRFTGGMTLMMTFAAWREANPPDGRDDPGIYANAVIYVGDMLHDAYLAEHAVGAAEQRKSVLAALDLLHAQFVQWVIASEFDARVEQRIAAGHTPDGGSLSAIYLDLLREYYGPELAIDSLFGREWMVHAVPFLSYEHQFWPAAMAVAAEIVEGLRRGDPGARRAIDGVLGVSATDRTAGLLRACNVDLSGPGPYRALLATIDRWLDRWEALAQEP